MGGRKSLVITCEHGGNTVPKAFRYLFKNDQGVLQTHRGWDPGALDLAKYLKKRSGGALFYSTISRLLVEANRSETNDELFSEYSKMLSQSVKKNILEKYYYSYRNEVERYLKNLTDEGMVIKHISIHTFTPLFDRQERTTDIGLLFDESRQTEAGTCHEWRTFLSCQLPHLTIDLNEPYRGTDDGFTTYLRERFPDTSYSGIEIEVSQKLFDQAGFGKLRSSLAEMILDH